MKQPMPTHKLISLTDNQIQGLQRVLSWIEKEIKDSGDCDHTVGICYCSLKVDIINSYDLLHSLDPILHEWVQDFVWADDGTAKKILRCKQCYEEKPDGFDNIHHHRHFHISYS
jgi:hypothetical protein